MFLQGGNPVVIQRPSSVQSVRLVVDQCEQDVRMADAYVVRGVFSIVTRVGRQHAGLLLFRRISSFSRGVVHVASQVIMDVARFLLVKLTSTFNLVQHVGPRLDQVALVVVRVQPMYVRSSGRVLIQFVRFLFRVQRGNNVVR